MFDFIQGNAIVLFCAMAAAIVLLIALWIAWAVKQSNKQREKEFNNNRDTEMLRVRISELEKEVAQMHEHEAQMLAEADFARLVDDPAAEQPSDAEKPEEKGAEESAQPDPDDTTSAKEPAEQNAAPVEETEQNGDQPESV